MFGFYFYNFVIYVVKIELRVKFENKSNIPIVILYNNIVYNKKHSGKVHCLKIT